MHCNLDSRKIIFQVIKKESFDSFMKCWLIAFHREAVVIGACYHSANRHEENIDKRINRFSWTRIGDMLKLIDGNSSTQTMSFAHLCKLPIVAQSPWPCSGSIGGVSCSCAVRSGNCGCDVGN